MNRLQLIKKLACKLRNNKVNLAGIERQAVMLADREYVTVSKQVAQNTELDFNQ
jgi:hypothetical protein